MIDLQRVGAWLFPDRRPDHEKAREREFIQAANSLKTLRVTPEGGMSIDPEELRGQIVAAREQLKHLVRKPLTTTGLLNPVTYQGANPIAGASGDFLDSIEVVSWRRLPCGAVVRYVCLQSTSTAGYSVATASLFSGDAESLPRWIDSDIHRRVAFALQNGKLEWHATVSQAMDAWDAEL
ncbi:hypothetical protein SOM59_17025 [Pseudomonas coleopterorum]|uniref:hypothetical protein n=1 Tax=Pseudomonas coleopterorum TaxID=1605838 RepID=UPI000F021A4B|nr:hypothetical protein [Pseudomonas coleopterorum]MDY1018793.1 hypothetical protein [Pseudomonas coleopterorum]